MAVLTKMEEQTCVCTRQPQPDVSFGGGVMVQKQLK